MDKISVELEKPFFGQEFQEISMAFEDVTIFSLAH